MQKNPDFSELQNEVIDHWENEAVEYFTTENVGFTAPDPTHYESFIKDEYQAILNDPLACVKELGFDSIASYLASKGRPNAKNKWKLQIKRHLDWLWVWH